MAASIKLIESFTWVNNTAAGQAALNTRYNRSGVLFNIANGGGRFAGNALRLSGDGFDFNYYGGSMGPDVVFGFAVNWALSTLGFSSIVFALNQLAGAGDEQISLRFDPAGHLTVTRLGTILATSTTVMQSNTFYYVELAVHFDAAAGSVALWINGVLEGSASGVNTQPRATPATAAGLFNNTSSPLFCDVYGMMGTLVPLGPQRVSLKLATANGSLQDWTPSAGNAFARVNTVPPDADANGFIGSLTPGDNSTFLFPALPFAPSVINAAQVSLYARFDDGGPHLVATLVKSGATTAAGTPQSIAASYLDFYLQVYMTDPNTGLAWSVAGLNAAEFGVNLNT